MPDEENTQPTPEPTQPETTTENPISEENSVPVGPNEPTEPSPSQTETSGPTETPPEPPGASSSLEEAISVKDQNPANEPLNQSTETAQTAQEPQQTEPNSEQNHAPETLQNPPETAPQPPTTSDSAETTPDKQMEPPTAHLPPIEPLDDNQAEKRKENLKLANETRQEKKREKVDKILEMFSENKEITNDEVEKLLHISDATATRYLETLEKEGKIKQVGKTGKGVGYTKI